MGGGGTLPSQHNQPTPEPAWVSPSGPQLVHSLWHCAPVAHPNTLVHTHTPVHSPQPHTQTHKCLVSSQSLLREQMVFHLHHYPLLQGVSLAHRFPRPSPRLGTCWHSQAFEKRVTEQGTQQRQVVQSVGLCSYKALVQHRLNVLII